MASGGIFTTKGVAIVMDRTFVGTPTYSEPTVFKVGIGTTTATIADTDMTTQVPITGTELADNCETIAEWAETADGADSLNSTTYKEGAGAMNLIKSGATADNVTYYNNNGMTSLDITSKTLHVWLYIKDVATYAKLKASGTAVELRYGIDWNTNYYYKTHTKAVLAVGWNMLTLDENDTEQGTVVKNAMDSGAIKITFTAASDTTVAGDVIVDDFKLAEAGDYTKTYETGYPEVDETTKQVTVRTRLATTEANNYNISEHGLFNTDSSALMLTKDVFTAYSKSDTDELIFVEEIAFDNE